MLFNLDMGGLYPGVFDATKIKDGVTPATMLVEELGVYKNHPMACVFLLDSSELRSLRLLEDLSCGCPLTCTDDVLEQVTESVL